MSEKKALFFGDAHFSSLNPFNVDAGNNFLKWIEQQNFGDKEDTVAFFAGDMTERDSNPGIPIAQLCSLMKYCHTHFKWTYIIMGNHDIKLYHGILQHTLMFIKEMFDNIVVIDDLTEVNIFDMNVLCMPHKYGVDFYEEYNKFINNNKDQRYDAVTGHFYCKEGFGDFVDVDKLNVRMKAIGHIHTRIHEDYLGSLWPNQKLEDPVDMPPRGIKVLTKDSTSAISMPKFLEYATVNYPDDLPKTSTTTVYIVNNCSMEQAKEKYGSDKYIKIGKPKVENISVSSITQSVQATDKTNFEYFNEMITELDLKPSRSAYRVVQSLIA